MADNQKLFVEDLKTITSTKTYAYESEEDEEGGDIYEKLESLKVLESLTGFPAAVITDLYQCSLPFWQESRGRGPMPQTSWLDHIVIIIMMYKLGSTVNDLSVRLQIKLLEDVITRARPVLNKTLTKRWWENRSRPKPLNNTGFPHAALLIDSTSIQIYKPLGSFNESKIMYDGKNCIYALKKEIAVMASPPYYALFSAKGVPGSVHDYTIFKQNYKTYIPYLVKSNEEKKMIMSDTNQNTWSIIADKGYTGPNTDTPELRRFFPSKKERVESKKIENAELSRMRVWVECFFGRMYMSFSFMRKSYPFSLNHFDHDIDNIILLLTNEHIRLKHPLAEEERKLYREYLSRKQQKKKNRIQQ